MDLKFTKLLLFVLVLLSLILSGCEGVNVSERDINRISEGIIKCDFPYMRFAAGCCLDENSNGICDNDEDLLPEGIGFALDGTKSNVVTTNAIDVEVDYGLIR